MPGLPIKANLDYKYGDSYSGDSVIWEDEDKNPIDLTDFLASMQVRDSDGAVVLHLDSATETGLTIEALAGKVIFDATAFKMTDSDLVAGEIYDYDLQVKSDDGNTVRTLMEGKFSVHEEATEV